MDVNECIKYYINMRCSIDELAEIEIEQYPERMDIIHDERDKFIAAIHDYEKNDENYLWLESINTESFDLCTFVVSVYKHKRSLETLVGKNWGACEILINKNVDVLKIVLRLLKDDIYIDKIIYLVLSYHKGEMFELLWPYIVNINYKSKSNTLLNLSCFLNKDTIFYRILSRKPDVNLTGILGTTALMFACKNGNINMVNELINNGADIHVKDCQNKNALSYAYENGSENIVLLLLIKGSKIVVNNV